MNKRMKTLVHAANGKNTPFVSVVIPVYNGAKYLEQAVQSVLKSTYRNFEILLIDDGSKDSSKRLCDELAHRYPERISFYPFAKNKGLGRVLNFALKKAKGELICRINQDDQMYPDRISKQVAFLLEHPDVVLVGSWLLVEDEQGNRRINRFLAHDRDLKNTWLSLSPCWDAAVMYRKTIALETGGYDQKFWPADDLHMWYKLGLKGKIANIQEPLVRVKFHADAVSVKKHTKHMVSLYAVHRWAHRNVQNAPLGTQLFWVGQLTAGYLFPATFNWFIYRYIKQYFVYRRPARLTNRKPAAENLVHLSYAVFPSYS